MPLLNVKAFVAYKKGETYLVRINNINNNHNNNNAVRVKVSSP